MGVLLDLANKNKDAEMLKLYKSDCDKSIAQVDALLNKIKSIKSSRAGDAQKSQIDDEIDGIIVESSTALQAIINKHK